MLQSAFSQEIFFRTGLGPAAYGKPGDGIAFISEIGWSYRHYTSISFAYTHLQQFNHSAASYHYYDNETGNDTFFSLPDGISYAKLSSSFRIFGYFNWLSFFHKESLKKWHLDTGLGMGFWQGISNLFIKEEEKVTGALINNGKGFNVYGRIHVIYEYEKWQLGLTGGLDSNAKDEPIAFLTFNIGFKILLN